jgi:GntR family transcriptional regulator
VDLPLDRDSPVPLYHQLAVALRWQISTGKLGAGERLPPVREAARELGVNMHTVRRAYAALAADGLVESSGSRGTCVLGQVPAETATSALDQFVDRMAREARSRFGLPPAELAALLAARTAHEAESAPPVVHVLECSESQCADHAEEIEKAWAVEARPWSLERSGEPPAGPLVATYFHYAEVVRRWPQRRGDTYFLPIHVDPALPHRLSGAARLEACELDEDRARNLKSDLEALFPPEAVPVVARVGSDFTAALDRAESEAVLCFAPRAWARLTRQEQEHPRARKVRYVIDADAIEALGHHFGWRRAGDVTTADRRRAS